MSDTNHSLVQRGVAAAIALLLGALLSGPPANARATVFACAGDCNSDGDVTIEELLIGVSLAQDGPRFSACASFDADVDAAVTIDEILQAVDKALNGCAAPAVTVLHGACRQPGSNGLQECTRGTPITVFRCDERARCLDDVAARTLLVDGTVDALGRFAVTLPPSQAAGATLLIEAAFADMGTDAEYRTLARMAPAAAGGAPAASMPPPEAVIDPSAEGALRAVDAAGLENVADTDAQQLGEQVRGDTRADYAGMSVSAAADAATDIAFDTFFVNPYAIALSPDGAHLYAAGWTDNAIAIFGRDAATGHLSFIEVQRNDGGGVDGLSTVTSVAVSPDGAYVYAAGSDDDAIAVLSRDAASGRLSFVEAQRDGANGVRGLRSVQSVSVSPDGAHLYAAALSGALVVFQRDTGSGRLSFVEAQRNGTAGVDGLAGARSVTLSPDGAHVYVASFTDNALAVFRRDAATGRLTFVQAQRDGLHGTDDSIVSGVTVSSDGTRVFASAFHGPTLAVYSRDPSTGSLTFLETRGHLLGASAVALSPDGTSLYTPTDNGDALAVFHRDPATESISDVQELRDGVDGVDGLAGANAVTVSADGAYVYVAGSVDAAVTVFARDPATGGLSFVEAARAFYVRRVGLNGIRSVAVSPDGTHVYSAAATDRAVAAFARDPGTGALSMVDLQRDESGNGFGYVDFVTLSPDGTQVYTAYEGGSTVAVFQRDLASGALTLQQVLREGEDAVLGLNHARSVFLSPDGAHAYVAAWGANAIGIFARDGGTGRLTVVEKQRPGAEWMAISADGAYVYAVDHDFLTVHSRDPATGFLTLVQTLEDGIAGIDGLRATAAVTLSPDGANVYVASVGDNAVTVFTRDATTGAVRLMEVQRDGENGVDGLWQAESIAVSPDGAHLYAVGGNDNALVLFRRAPGTGRLTFVQLWKDGVGGVDGLNGPVQVAVSPDGANVYVAAIVDNAIGVFRRDAATGLLTFVEARR